MITAIVFADSLAIIGIVVAFIAKSVKLGYIGIMFYNLYNFAETAESGDIFGSWY